MAAVSVVQLSGVIYAITSFGSSFLKGVFLVHRFLSDFLGINLEGQVVMATMNLILFTGYEEKKNISIIYFPFRIFFSL